MQPRLQSLREGRSNTARGYDTATRDLECHCEAEARRQGGKEAGMKVAFLLH